MPPPANILILFVTGVFAHELEALTDIQILEEIMKFLRQIFPGIDIPNPIKYKFTRWSQDPLAYGSYSNFPVHTGPHTIKELAKETADGRVQWAGEHANVNDGTENWSFGCVHSAFQSGQRAAKTIRKQLCPS
jgi:polyamine oxidase